MRLPVSSVKNALASLGVAVAGLLAASLMLTAVAQAADTTTSTPPAAAPTATTASTATTAAGATTTAGATTATTAPLAGTQAIVAPGADWTPLNPGWRTDQMTVKVEPEFDLRAVLVIVDFSLPTDVPLPATLKFPVPAGARIAAIGEIDPNGNFTQNYLNSYPPVTQGFDWDVASIQVKSYRQIQVEYYYDPGIPPAAGPRSLPVWMEIPVDVGTLVLHVQQPARATGFVVKPALEGSGESDDDHFTYSVGAFTNVKAGSQLGQVIEYNNPDNGLSVATPGSTTTSKISTNTVLLTAILVVVVIIAIVVIWRVFFSSRRRPGGGAGAAAGKAGSWSAASGKNKAAGASGGKPSAAKPTKAAKQVAAPVPDEVATSEQTDQDATEYCVACGEALSPDSPFCTNCGEARS